jgi:DNA-binding transcriptional LysR family regulator
LIVPHLVAASDLVATLASRLVEVVAEPFALARLPLPIPVTGFSLAMAWHERDHHDPAHRWLRDELVAITGGRPRSRAPR